MNTLHRQTVAVCGLGLIGGSLALALRGRGYRVSGIDRSASALTLARRSGAVQRVTSSVEDGVRGADIIVLAVPFQFLPRVMASVARAASPAAVITDVTSVKEPVLALAKRRLPAPGRFVGGHPMAGRETSGFASASRSLFRGRVCVLTPVAWTTTRATAETAALWRAAGARVITMSPRRHDAAAAGASHLPHLVAFALAPLLGDRDVARLASGSFLDATRVAASDPALWEGILLANRSAILKAARGQARRTIRLMRLIRGGRPGPLKMALAAARRMRRRAEGGR